MTYFVQIWENGVLTADTLKSDVGFSALFDILIRVYPLATRIAIWHDDCWISKTKHLGKWVAEDTWPSYMQQHALNYDLP